MRCGLLGNKLSHSYSPQIHSHLGDYSYDLFEKTPDELKIFLQNGDFTGLNVTMPYKKDVIPLCDELSDRAAMLGAVNTIVRRPNGLLLGHNTDYFGFASLLRRSGVKVAQKKVLILGSGGASATVNAVLKDHGANVVIISRSGKNNYNNLHLHRDASVIVNTTPVGMYPNVGKSPVNLDLFPVLEGVLDVIYNPAKTQLLLDAEHKGIIHANGLWMLVAQAKESAEFFTGKKISDCIISEIHNNLSKQMENIVLIGMPGCGKSTIGQILAQQLSKRFVDTDAEVIKEVGMSIPEIFSRYGERGFREYETQILTKFGKESGLVLATGGGCVTRSENYPLLHQNGRIIWIRRDISNLSTDGRPLSQRNSLNDMYHNRQPLYEAFSDYHIENDTSPEHAVEKILKTEGYL